jgi:hypothetical protein
MTPIDLCDQLIAAPSHEDRQAVMERAKASGAHLPRHRPIPIAGPHRDAARGICRRAGSKVSLVKRGRMYAGLDGPASDLTRSDAGHLSFTEATMIDLRRAHRAIPARA